MFKFRGKSLLAAGVAVLSAALWFGAGAGTAKADDSGIDADVHKALDNKKFANVTASLHGPEVVLTGTVDTYAVKLEADNRVHHVKGVKGVDNEIRVAGPTVEDTELREKLSKALTYDREGYGTAPFNSLTIGVHDGVVTLGGTVYGPPDKDSALGLVANTAGVKDIVDEIKVAPVSPMDDRLRLQLERVIYGAPQLQKYALDPAKPIRITVVNGNVTLSGVVDNKMDHDVAGIRANTVPGVFKVVNDLEIAPPQASK